MTAAPRLLSLAQLTLLGADPLDLIDAAGEAGFSHIGMRIVPPMPDVPMRPVIGDHAYQQAIRERLAVREMKVLDIEAFWLTAASDVRALESAVAFGAELGATYVLVVGHDREPARLTDNFAGFAALAGSYGLKTSLEFIPYSAIRSLGEAADLVAAAGQAGAGLLVDALHVSRSGGTPADLARLPAGLVHYLHLCDAPATRPSDVDGMRDEARSARLYPGEGALPLKAFLAAAPTLAVGLEAPDRQRSHLSFAEQARQVRAAALALLAADDG